MTGKFVVRVNEKGNVLRIHRDDTLVSTVITHYRAGDNLLVIDAVDELDAFIQAEKLKEQRDDE